MPRRPKLETYKLFYELIPAAAKVEKPRRAVKPKQTKPVDVEQSPDNVLATNNELAG